LVRLAPAHQDGGMVGVEAAEPVLVSVSFNDKAQKNYPTALPVHLGYHTKTVSIQTAGAADVVRGCTFAGVSCT
jgi:hypothetical protein